MPRLDTSSSFRKEAYAALKRAITAMDIYDHAQEIRLDERRLSEGLGVSRTPIREAMTLLEQEGFVRTRPRRGIYVVRKTKREIVEMIPVWAALESMAARLAAERAGGRGNCRFAPPVRPFPELRRAYRRVLGRELAFHQAIIGMSGSVLLAEMTENLSSTCARSARSRSTKTIARPARSSTIFGSSRRSNAATRLAERLAREHTLGLAAHVEQHGDFLDTR